MDRIIGSCETQLGLNSNDLDRLPRKWELLGEVLVLKLHQGLKPHWGSIAEIYARTLNAKAVLRRVDKIQGTLRQPGVELIYGEVTETLHTENKVKFRFDPMKVMYSSGNIDERLRITKFDVSGECVVDMFAGIGYFTLPMAVHSRPGSILACELNPVAYDYLCENIELNKVGKIVRPILGDNRDSIQTGIADRIIMGYLKSEHSHRLSALSILKPSGGVIHFHDAGFKSEAVDSALEKMQESLTNSEFGSKFKTDLVSHYIVKSYGPKLVHLVLDIRFQPI